MTTPTIPPAVRNRLAFWALAGLALFVAHDAVFLAQIGPGQALVAEERPRALRKPSWMIINDGSAVYGHSNRRGLRGCIGTTASGTPRT